MRLHLDLLCLCCKGWPSALLSDGFVMSENVEELGGLLDMLKSIFQLDLLIPSELYFPLIRVCCTDWLYPLLSSLGGTLSCPPNSFLPRKIRVLCLVPIWISVDLLQNLDVGVEILLCLDSLRFPPDSST